MCFQKIAKVDLVTGEHSTSEHIDDKFTQVASKKTEEIQVEEIESISESEELSTEEEVPIFEEEENDQSDDLLEDYEQNNSDESDESPAEIEEIFQQFKEIHEKGRYEDFADMIENSDEISAIPGSYQNTLCFQDKLYTFAYGYRKLQLIRDNGIVVAIFAIYNILFETMDGKYKGNDVICLPSNKDAQVIFGRTRARMLCARMKEINDWLIGYQS